MSYEIAVVIYFLTLLVAGAIGWLCNTSKQNQTTGKFISIANF